MKKSASMKSLNEAKDKAKAKAKQGKDAIVREWDGKIYVMDKKVQKIVTAVSFWMVFCYFLGLITAWYVNSRFRNSPTGAVEITMKISPTGGVSATEDKTGNEYPLTNFGEGDDIASPSQFGVAAAFAVLNLLLSIFGVFNFGAYVVQVQKESERVWGEKMAMVSLPFSWLFAVVALGQMEAGNAALPELLNGNYSTGPGKVFHILGFITNMALIIFYGRFVYMDKKVNGPRKSSVREAVVAADEIAADEEKDIEAQDEAPAAEEEVVVVEAEEEKGEEENKA